jgi:rhomboid protease GluP
MPAPTPCPACNALNDVAFEDCIRCGGPLRPGAARKPRRPVRIALTRPARPIATIAFGVLTALVFAAQTGLAMAQREAVAVMPKDLNLADLRLGVLIPEPSLVREEPFRLLSAVFVHFGVVHFVMNGWAFIDLGRVAEQMLGRGRFAVTYVLAGIGGFVASFAVDNLTRAPVVPTAGASGAIFGLMGVVLGTLIARKDPRWKSFAVRGVIFMLVLGFAINASKVGIAINNAAHIGGLVVGVVAGLLARPNQPTAAPSRLTDTLGVVAFAASVASIALAYRSPLVDLFQR